MQLQSFFPREELVGGVVKDQRYLLQLRLPLFYLFVIYKCLRTKRVCQQPTLLWHWNSPFINYFSADEPQFAVGVHLGLLQHKLPLLSNRQYKATQLWPHICHLIKLRPPERGMEWTKTTKYKATTVVQHKALKIADFTHIANQYWHFSRSACINAGYEKSLQKLNCCTSVFVSFVFNEIESINNEEKSLSGNMPQLSVKVQYIQ